MCDHTDITQDRAGALSRPGRVDLVDYWEEGRGGEASPLELVRVEANEVAVVPFTTEAQEVWLHYADEAEVRGYLHCNGEGCVLCRAGRKVEGRILLPVYLPSARAVGVLAVSPSCRPGALRPQLMPLLRSGKRLALLLSRPDRTRFVVSPVELTEGMDDGAAPVREFLRRWGAGEVELASVYHRVDNRDLKDLPGVATMLQLKGVGCAHG
jgi:hypothetical protein